MRLMEQRGDPTSTSSLEVRNRKGRKPDRQEYDKGDYTASRHDEVDYTVRRHDEVHYAARRHDEFTDLSHPYATYRTGKKSGS